MKAIGIIITTITLTIYAILLNGWTLTKLWTWFLVPYGLNKLTIPIAIGLAIIVYFLTYHPDLDKEEKKEESWIKFLKQFLYPTIKCFGCLFIAWIVKHWV